jgi:outer membrane protein
MLKTRLILIAACAVTVWLIFLLPKSVVENEAEMKSTETKTSTVHSPVDPLLQNQINQLRLKLTTAADSLLGKTTGSFRAGRDNIIGEMIQGAINRARDGGHAEQAPVVLNSAIFADSLASLYQKATRYDSAAWCAEQANVFFETPESKLKAGEAYYQAFSFAVENTKRNEFATKARSFFQQILDENPSNLDVKTKMALTYIGTSTPMQGITMLREVLVADPKFKPALFNMGMLSVQSGQHAKAIEWLNKLLAVDPDDVQGRLLLGVAYTNNGQKEKAREQFEMAKKLDSDPAVQQQADAYLKDLK